MITLFTKKKCEGCSLELLETNESYPFSSSRIKVTQLWDYENDTHKCLTYVLINTEHIPYVNLCALYENLLCNYCAKVCWFVLVQDWKTQIYNP